MIPAPIRLPDPRGRMTPAPIRLPDTRGRLTPGRKSLILTALRRGEITRGRVLFRYRLTEAELQSWEARFAAHGQVGLASTKLQEIGRDG